MIDPPTALEVAHTATARQTNLLQEGASSQAGISVSSWLWLVKRNPAAAAVVPARQSAAVLLRAPLQRKSRRARVRSVRAWCVNKKKQKNSFIGSPAGLEHRRGGWLCLFQTPFHADCGACAGFCLVLVTSTIRGVPCWDRRLYSNRGFLDTATLTSDQGRRERVSTGIDRSLPF